MNIVLLQTDIAWASPAVNIQRASRLMVQAPGADLYVLPEMWATGFATEPTGIAEPESDSASLAWMRQTAAAHSCAVCGSLAVIDHEGKYRNRHYFVTPEGVEHYDKHHLFTHGHEDRFFSAGQRHVVVQWRGFRLLLLTCYDLRFPVWSRWGSAGEYDAIVVVANWPQKRQLAWDTLLRARAIENQSYVIAVNRVGTDAMGIDYEGHSCVIDPVGRTMVSCTKNAEQAVETVLDKKDLLKMREHFRVLDDRDQFTV